MRIKESVLKKLNVNQNEKLVKNFKKVIDELNFKNNTKFRIDNQSYGLIFVYFNNNWSINIWDDDKYSMYYNGECLVLNQDFDQLLKFMEKMDIRNTEQSKYKDAELYIIDFE